MSHHTTTTHTAGGLEGLALGAPIGGGSAPSGTATGLISSVTGSAPVGGSGSATGPSTDGTGIGSGLTGSSSSNTTSTQPGAYDSGAHNSTSGERGIGGGRGGPTAFESDASRVGTTGGAGDHGHVGHSHSHGTGSHSHSHGITGPTGTGAGDDQAAIKALTGAGHHDQSRVGQYDSGATTGSHGSSHGHGLAAAGAGAGLAGAGAAGLASHGHRGGEVDDSVTGQEHFRSSVGEQTTGNVPRASTLTSSGAGVGSGVSHGTATGAGAPVASGGSGFGAGSLAGAGAAGAGAGAAAHHGTGSHGNNPVKELKQELKEHQSAPGYDKAEHHTETDGPHGLVWHNGKYVHKRELEGKGSTGVPLK